MLKVNNRTRTMYETLSQSYMMSLLLNSNKLSEMFHRPPKKTNFGILAKGKIHSFNSRHCIDVHLNQRHIEP